MKLKETEIIVLQAVMNNNLPVGAIQLSGILNISQATVGRILLSLENQLFLKKSQNKGRIITEKGINFIQEHHQKLNIISTATQIVDTAKVLSLNDLLEILQIRLLLEPYVAQQCAKNITKEIINDLKNLQLEYMYELRHGRNGNEQDLKLHLKIAKAAGNETISRILKLILVDKHSYYEFTKAAEQLKALNLKEHDLILQAIYLQDSARAATEMESHLKHVIDNVKKSYENKVLKYEKEK